jgi:hypothetical protein
MLEEGKIGGDSTLGQICLIAGLPSSHEVEVLRKETHNQRIAMYAMTIFQCIANNRYRMVAC